ncbi:MAG: hypothetical protein ACD_4C00091G0001 [uncultured bacterium (gcode 4)]|uniref:PriA DNA helicase Cys-rich region (CRR) domain-containing protein n=1 Tax=uncultured bacterium (gcode 4) TaxID=1234023 RepID=K2FYL0_9BACT|nr:MAG: hypothetical protein ACD_4C00091G0001 [uncultured bacterium (gcode 4)]
MINIIDLNYSHNPYPLLSQNIIDLILENISKNKKTLLFLNRRWESNSLICKDCSNQIKCDFCDIWMVLHKYPLQKLICHHCHNEKEIPMTCPKCHSTNLNQVWVWIQKVEDNIRKIFKENEIIRLDSDKIHKEWISREDIKKAQIIISTESVNTISIDNLGLVWFLLLELEFLIPEYNIEEQIYDNISYNMKRWSDIAIQTYIPNSSFINILTEWNFKDFLMTSLKERKDFNYPPYKELVYVWVKSKSQEKVKDIIIKLKNKLEINNTENKKVIFYDKELFSKRASEYHQKIVIKWEDLQEFLSCIKFEVFRNKEINIEWK